MRLWPLVLLSSAICLTVGYVGMLPDDYENLSQSVIATNCMSQNILSCITTGNYWDSVNDYKPLMHMWYVGILIEFYLFLLIVVVCFKWICSWIKIDCVSNIKRLLCFLCIGSLVLYLLPSIPTQEKFYYLPCRLFELLGGGLVGLYVANKGQKRISSKNGMLVLLAIVLLLCCSLYMPQETGEINSVNGKVVSNILVPQNILLLLVVALTCVFVCSKSWNVTRLKSLSAVAFIGKMSFSIFVWHQIILAFYRYFVSDDMSVGFVGMLWLITICLSVATYYCIEIPVKATWRNFGVSVAICILTILPASWVYVNAGVVRDVPELNIKKGEVHRGMFAEYCDRVYGYNKDFPTLDNGKINVLVAGVSFGRDFANILLESEWADKINLSYIFRHDEQYVERYKHCDVLFTFINKPDVPNYVWDNVAESAKVIGLGTKNFGECNGIVYQHRSEEDYLQSTITINPNYYDINEKWKQAWGENNYIDFISYSTAPDGKIRVFTDDGKFISQDCRHLTQDGAKFFANIIEFNHHFQ